MSNTKNSAPERESIYHAISEYKMVSSGGRWRNNVGGPVDDKIAFQSSCKFALAIENSSSPDTVPRNLLKLLNPTVFLSIGVIQPLHSNLIQNHLLTPTIMNLSTI